MIKYIALCVILIGVVVTMRVTRRVAAVGGVVCSRPVVLAPHFCFRAIAGIRNVPFEFIMIFHVESWIEVDLVHRHGPGGEEHGVLVGDGDGLFR